MVTPTPGKASPLRSISRTASAPSFGPKEPGRGAISDSAVTGGVPRIFGHVTVEVSFR